MSEWYERSFGNDYLIVYKHRDFQGAYNEVKRMIGWLDLPRGASVLDLCCGMGRHSMALADFGYKVTGVDLSDVLLQEAVKRDARCEVTWVKADMRNVPLDMRFDAVVNLFTSFGYFDSDEENAKVLKEIERMLVPKGKFIIDFLNPQYVASRLVPYSERSESNTVIQETRQIEDGFVRKKILIKQLGQPDRHYLEQVKLYDLPSFREMMEKTNLQIDYTYGNYDESSYSESLSPRLIIVGHRKG
jgi:ubiquinone/menaquinone biosynthesis C-methylase UbiE